MSPASLGSLVPINKQVAGYNEALPRCSSMLKLLRSFFWYLNPSLRCSGVKENQGHQPLPKAREQNGFFKRTKYQVVANER